MDISRLELEVERTRPDAAASRASQATDGRRLVVVVAGVTEEALLAGQVLLLAQPRNLEVLLFGVTGSESQQARVRRELATTAAFLQNHGIRVALTVASGASWIAALSSALRHGDDLACYAEGETGIARGPLSDLLSRSLEGPVYDLSGIHRSRLPAGIPILKQAGAWVGSLAIVVAFGLLQAWTAGALRGSAQTAVLVFTLLPELTLLLGWNSLFA